MAKAKFDGFVQALEALCLEHGVQIATSGYDIIEVWDLEAGESPIYQGRDQLKDKTEDPNGSWVKAENGSYALFIYEPNEAAGGVDDLKHIGTMAECVALAEASDHELCCHIVLLPTLEIVRRGEWAYTPSPIVGQPITWHYEWVAA